MKNLLKTLKAFANSNAASSFYTCAIAQNADLTAGGFAALTWVEIGSVGSIGETGKNTNILNYDTRSDAVTQKAKGLTDAGSPEIEVARVPLDPGQILLRSMGVVGNNNNYAFKELHADGAVGETGTVLYNRGLVTGPKRTNGRNEDFDLEIFTLAYQQEEVVVDPTTAGNAPTLTVIPAITGTAQVGVELTSDNGTFTGDATITYAYQWYAGGVAIAGATLATFTPAVAQLGLLMSSRVYATNDSGSAFGFSDVTTAVIAA